MTEISIDIPNLTIKKRYWSKLGVNISPNGWSSFNAETNLDLVRYARSAFDKIRIQLRNHSDSSSALTAQQTTIQQARSLGFSEIMWGVVNNSVPQTNASMTSYMNDVLVQAGWANDNGVTDFQVGNELDTDAHRLQSITSITTPVSANKARVLISAGHDYTDGQTVEISGVTGANAASYNGTFAIFNVTPTTFDYQMAGNVVTPAGGSPKVGFPLSYLRGIIRTIAANVKTAYPNLKISYSASQGGSGAGWLADGDIGQLDMMYINAYGTTETDIVGFRKTVTDWKNKFGAKAGVTEVNVWIQNWSTTTVSEADQARLLKLRLDVLKEIDLPGYIFTFNWFTTGNPFALYKQTGEFRPAWDIVKTEEYKIGGI